MPTGPWGYGMDKCIQWVKSNKKSVDDPGAYCGGIKATQEKGKKVLKVEDVSFSALWMVSDTDLMELGKSIAKSTEMKDEVVDAALMVYTEMADRGIPDYAPAEIDRWINSGHEKAVQLQDIFKYMPTVLSQPVDVMLMGEATIRGMVGRYGTITLRVNKAERSEALENEILAKIGCPHVKEKVEFVWGVDPSDEGMSLYKGGSVIVVDVKSVCDCLIKTLSPEFPDSCFAYVKDGKRRFLYKDNSGRPHPVYIEGSLEQLSKAPITAGDKSRIRKVLMSAAREVGAKVGERSGVTKFEVEFKEWVEIDNSNGVLKAVPQSVYTVEALGRKWSSNTNPLEGGTCIAEYHDNLYVFKKKKTITTVHEAPYLIRMEDRCQVIEVQGIVMKETSPMSNEWVFVKAQPESTFPYIMREDAMKDVVVNKMFIMRGQAVDVLTFDKVLGSEGTRVSVGFADAEEANYEGRHRINGTFVTSRKVGAGMVKVEEWGIVVDGKPYEVNLKEGTIINK